MSRVRRTIRLVPGTWHHVIAGLLIVTLTPRGAAAWGKTGHRVVAAIAWMNMSPSARAAAIALLTHAPANSGILELRPPPSTSDCDELWFIEVATWPDLVRFGPHAAYNRPSWHFTDHYWERADSASGPPRDLARAKRWFDERGAPAFVAIEKELRDSTVGVGDKAVDLAWLLHLIGDLHQPLHNSARVTPDLPNGDRGGNNVTLTASTNLHAYWDDILDLSYEAEQAGGRTKAAVKAYEREPDYVRDWALEIAQAHPAQSVLLDKSLDAFDDWSREGLSRAQTYAYVGVHAGQPPTPAYRKAIERVAEQAIAEAGYRTAALLNAMFR